MNYRHAYHAGNFADVLKHIVLVNLVQHFLKKETGFCYLDSHAGRGLYDLTLAPLQNKKETEEGIKKIMFAKEPSTPLFIKNYIDTINTINANSDLKFYPGSPLFVKKWLRPQDRMVLSELHPEESAALKKLFRGDPQIFVHQQDGYLSLKSFLPPKEKRGLVLIDPPYEKPDEWTQILKALTAAIDRWPTGVYALWYPIKNRQSVDRFLKSLNEKIAQPHLIAELAIYNEEIPLGLNGCGMAIINPPWQFDQQLEKALPWLWKALSSNGQGGYRVK